MNTRPEMVHQTKLFEEQTPMQRMANVDEMVGPAIFLLSDAASFVTGNRSVGGWWFLLLVSAESQVHKRSSYLDGAFMV